MLKLGIDEGLANIFNGTNMTGDYNLDDGIQFNMKYANYPSMPLRIYTNFSEMAVEGAFYLLLIPMLTFIFITTDILKEKEKSLRKGMMTMGLRSSVYWMSWFLTSMFFALLSTIVTIIAGNLLHMKYFTDTCTGLNFIMLFLFSMSM